MPLPIVRDGYDSDPEIQAEMELAKKDPIKFAIDENSLTSQKKVSNGEAVAKKQISTSPPNATAGSVTKNRKPSDENAKGHPKTGNQTKALKKQRSRGISGCSSRKYSGFEDDYDGYDLDGYDYDTQDVFDDFDEEEEYKNTTITAKKN